MRTRLGCIAVVVILAAGCATQTPAPAEPPDNRATEEAVIRAAIKDWVGAAQAKDAAKFTSFYADAAVVMMEDAPDVRTSASIKEAMAGMMQDPNFSLTFEPDQVVVARSADLAYETGTYAMTMSGPDKQPAHEKGNYVVVWQKQADGAWKVVVDAPVSDPPGPAAPAPNEH